MGGGAGAVAAGREMSPPRPRMGKEICYLLLAVFVTATAFGLGRFFLSFGWNWMQ